jgi:DNA polymerase III alpha subunit (gram-positive type)
MSYIVVDVESDGVCPPLYSMVCFGAVKIDDKLNKKFYGKVKPISVVYDAEALKVSGISREQHLEFDTPEEVMRNFAEWLGLVSIGNPVFISDNPAFDWQWINYYFHKYYGSNPFGHSARRIGDLYCGLMKDAGVNRIWKQKYRKTVHTHNPVDDAMGNAEALLAFRDELGLKISF